MPVIIKLVKNEAVNMEARPVGEGGDIIGRQLWFGDVPHDHDEKTCVNDFRFAGLPVPTRFLVRASTGTKHGFYGIAYFVSVQDALTVKAFKRMPWSDGTTGPIGLLNGCASNTCVFVFFFRSLGSETE